MTGLHRGLAADIWTPSGDEGPQLTAHTSDGDIMIERNVGSIDWHRLGEEYLPGFSEENLGLLMYAASCGWEVMVTATNAATAISPDGQHRHHFTPRRIPDGKGKRLVRDLRDHGVPSQVNYVRQMQGLLGRHRLAASVPIKVTIVDAVQLGHGHCGDPEKHEQHSWELFCPWPRLPDGADPTDPRTTAGIFHCSGKPHHSHTEATMQRYDRANFDRSLTSAVSAENRKLIEEAVTEHGWTLTVTGKNVLKIVSPDGAKTFSFGASTKQGVNVRAIRSAFARHSTPEAAPGTTDAKPGPDFEPPTMALEEFPPEPAERRLVSEQPWMAHSGTTKGTPKAYPTRNTIERTWSDGTKDYRCAYEGCDYTHDRPKNVVTHFAAKHVRHGDLDKQGRPDLLVDDPNFEGTGLTRKVRPRKSRIAALAGFLAGLDLRNLTPEEIAERSLEFLADLSNSGSPDAQEREPLTPEQIITRIRSLVDSGRYVEQQDAIEERDGEIAALAEQAEALKAELAAERERRTTLEGSLTALKELIRDIVPADTIGKG